MERGLVGQVLPVVDFKVLSSMAVQRLHIGGASISALSIRTTLDPGNRLVPKPGASLENISRETEESITLLGRDWAVRSVLPGLKNRVLLFSYYNLLVS